MDIFDLVTQTVVGHDKELGLLVMWNGSATFNAYAIAPDGALEATYCFETGEGVTYAEALQQGAGFIDLAREAFAA